MVIMKKLALLLAISLLPAHLRAMAPHTARPSLVCHTVKQIADQITQHEQLSDQDQSELLQLLKKCEQDKLLFNPIDVYGHFKGQKFWNKWCGYENGIKLEVLELLKPFIKNGGTPFLEHCLASAIRYDERDKVKILVEDLHVNVNAIDSRDANHECGTPASMLDVALLFDYENSLQIFELLLQNGANIETFLWHGVEITRLGYLLHKLQGAEAETHPEYKNNILAKIALLLRHGANTDVVNGGSTSLVQHLEQSYDFDQYHSAYSTDQAHSKEKLRKKRALINEIYALVTAATKEMAEQQKPIVADCFGGLQGISDLVLQYACPDLAQEQQEYYEKECDKRISQRWPEVAGELAPFLTADELPEFNPGYELERENPIEIIGEFMNGYAG
jgi:hypothetical protein